MKLTDAFWKGYLRALFNYGIKRDLISKTPTNGIEFLPEEKKKKYVPPKEDALKVINSADSDTQDYLWSIVLYCCSDE